jgi:curved DNA-binding protein CbpA
MDGDTSNPDGDGTRERLAAWDVVLDECSYYEILGVEELSDETSIRSAYHRFARVFHPDAHLGDEPALIAIAQRVFQRGTEAYRVLTHPDLRVRYDMTLARGRVRLVPSEMPKISPETREPQPLHELCRSAGAKLAAQRAARWIDSGDPAAAKRELLLALEHDGGANGAIQERIDALDVVLYAMGVLE